MSSAGHGADGGPATSRGARGRRQAMRVLIAEDDADLRDALAEAVRECGHRVDACGDGLEAWGRFVAAPHDALITDWRMPGLEGPELARRVRAHGDAPGRY